MFDTALAWRRSSTSCNLSSLIQHLLRFFFTNPTIYLALSLNVTSMLGHSSFGVVSCGCLAYYLLLLASAITHKSHVQGTVLEPCSRHNIQLNESMDPFRWAVGGTASTSDVFCRLFGTTITTFTSRQSPAQHVCAKSTDPSP